MRCSSRPPRGSFPLLLLLTACADSSDGGSGPIGVNNAVQAFVVSKSGAAFAGIAEAHLLLPTLLTPSMHAAAGITFELDTSPSAPPNTYDFVLPFDSDGDGTKDTTMSGRTTLTADPFPGGLLIAGFQADTDVVVHVEGLNVFEAELELAFDANGFGVSGSGTYVDPDTQASVHLEVDPSAPLHVRTASDEPGHVANACAWSVDGSVSVDAATSDGNYSAMWVFSPTSSLIQVLNAFFAPPGGSGMPLINSQFEAAPCPGAGSIDDWAGTFTFDWFCIPPEVGQSELAITVLDASTIEIVDEDPPGSGEIHVYQAERDAHDPHVVHGSFQAGSGGTYEETFTWILADDLQTFQQVSQYVLLTGPFAGAVGDCGGVAVRD